MYKELEKHVKANTIWTLRHVPEILTSCLSAFSSEYCKKGKQLQKLSIITYYQTPQEIYAKALDIKSCAVRDYNNFTIWCKTRVSDEDPYMGY